MDVHRVSCVADTSVGLWNTMSGPIGMHERRPQAPCVWSGVACLLSLMFGIQDEFPSACARGCLSTFAPRLSENTRRDVVSDIRNRFAWPPTFAVFTRGLFHRVRRLPILVWVGGCRHFRLGQSFVARFTSCEAGASPKRDGTQNPQFRFQGRRWFIHTSSCTEK